jgi:hypothetical protein
MRMKKNLYGMCDEEFAAFSRKYPNVTREMVSDIEGILAEKMHIDMAFNARQTEIEQLKSKALGAMGTESEMKFSDIESGMLRASLSDGRQALKEIMEKIPTEAPSCDDGTKMKDQGRKKKHNDNVGDGRGREPHIVPG